MNITDANLQDQRVPMIVPESHFVNGTELEPPFPVGFETAIFGMGCFWGPEKRFWELEGVYTTAVGYAGGYLANPTYREVCSRDTGHAEVVLVVHDPAVISYEQLLKFFWEGHNPTHRPGQRECRSSAMRSSFRWPVMIEFRRKSGLRRRFITLKKSINSILLSIQVDTVDMVEPA